MSSLGARVRVLSSGLRLGLEVRGTVRGYG